jgi:hypothetical protein
VSRAVPARPRAVVQEPERASRASVLA